MANGFDIKLVTVNDEPSLKTGEFLLDRDNEVMYVGYMGSTDIDYRSNLPMRVVNARFTRIPTYYSNIIVPSSIPSISNNVTQVTYTATSNILSDYLPITFNFKGE